MRSSLAVRSINWVSSDLLACDEKKDAKVWRVVSGGRLVVLWAVLLLLMLAERDHIAAAAYAALIAAFAASFTATPP